MDESQNIMLSKGSQAQTNTYCITAFIWSSKPNKINLRVWWKKSDSGYLWGEIGKGLTWKGQEETFDDENVLYFFIEVWVNPCRHLSKLTEYIPKLYVEISSVLCSNYNFIFREYFRFSDIRSSQSFYRLLKYLSINYKS